MVRRVLLLLPLAASLAAAEPRDVRTDLFATAVACAPCHGNADDSGALRTSGAAGSLPTTSGAAR